MLGILKNLFEPGNSKDLATLIKDGTFLADVRTRQEFAVERVPGAVNIPLDKLPDLPVKLSNKKYIIVFCRSGNRSSQAKIILNQNGFTNVTNGGSWKNESQYKQ